MGSTNYREFSSFYAMKEWLKQGEFILPAIYKTLNDGKFYFDDVLFSKDTNSVLYNGFKDKYQGITFNKNGEVSRVLSEHMDSNFVTTRKVEDLEGVEHSLNTSILSGSANVSFNEFSAFKNYGSLREKRGQNYHNMILPKQFAGSDITGIVIPEGVEYIGTKAFYHCDSLEYVKLPSTLKCIGRAAFQSCKSLKEIYIPENCEVIENAAFMSCGRLKKVTIANGVKKILNHAFAYTGIESLFLPNSVTTVLSKSFAYCLNLKRVYIGANVNSRTNNGDANRDTTLNGMAFYHSPIEKFCVDERNENVKVGCNGELMIKHNVLGGWMIIKVPYSYEGMYVADPTAVSMIRNLFDKGHSVKYSNYHYNNIGDGLKGINFNNIKSVPKYLCANNINIETIEMPHIHKIHNSAFNTKSIKNIVIGSIDDEDDFLSTRAIKIIKSDKNKQQNITFSNDLTITINVGSQSFYETHEFWRRFYPLSTYTIGVGKEWRKSAKPNPDSNAYFGPYESFSNKYSESEDYSVANMSVVLCGYENFNLYIRYSGETGHDFIMASKPNVDITVDNFTGNIFDRAHIPNSGTSISSYTPVLYSGLETSGNNKITISYIKDDSVNKGDDCGYALIPMDIRGFYGVVDTSGNYIMPSTIFNDDYFMYSSNNSTLLGTFYKITIYFKNLPKFKLRVGSGLNSNGGILCVSCADKDMTSLVQQSLEDDDFAYKNFNWSFTTQDSYNNVLPNSPNAYRELIFNNDGGIHFVEVYFIRDSTCTSVGQGYVAIPKKQL